MNFYGKITEHYTRYNFLNGSKFVPRISFLNIFFQLRVWNTTFEQAQIGTDAELRSRSGIYTLQI